MSTPKPLLHTRARLWGWEQKKPTRALLFYKGDPTVQRASGCPRDSHMEPDEMWVPLPCWEASG